MNSTAIIANTTASGVIPPAKAVAAPIERAVATAGAMWVMAWNSSSVIPIASRSRLPAGADAGVDMDSAIPTSSGRPGGVRPSSIVCTLASPVKGHETM